MKEADRETDRKRGLVERAGDLGSSVGIRAQGQSLGGKGIWRYHNHGQQNLVTEHWQQIGRREELKNPGHKEVQTIYFGYML